LKRRWHQANRYRYKKRRQFTLWNVSCPRSLALVSKTLALDLSEIVTEERLLVAAFNEISCQFALRLGSCIKMSQGVERLVAQFQCIAFGLLQTH